MSGNKYGESKRNEVMREEVREKGRWIQRTVLLTVVVVGLHSLEGGGTGDEFMGERGLVLLATVIVVEPLVVLSLLAVVAYGIQSVQAGENKIEKVRDRETY